MDAHKGALVAQIKEMQKTDQQAKQQWGYYCTSNGGGIRDPNKHPAEFISTFLEQYSAGQLVAEIAPESELTQCIKTAQQKSRAFGNAWNAYCSAHGKGVHDPLKHEPGFLQEFLTFVGDQAQIALGASPGGPPAKRHKGAGPGGLGGLGGFGGLGGAPSGLGGLQALLGAMGGAGGGMGRAMGGAGSDPMKDALVNKIKTFQRSGQEAKELWWAHCDGQLGGVRDPAKHSAGILKAFIAMNQIA